MANNKIKIPWYRFEPRRGGFGSGANLGGLPDFPAGRFPRPRLNLRPKPRAQEEPVREPVDEKVRERDPAKVPNRYPILDPRQLPDAQNDPGSNPYRSPSPGMIPVPKPSPSPAPNPRRDPGKSPGVNQKQPMPQVPALPFTVPYSVPSGTPSPGYQYTPSSPDLDFRKDFISDVERVSRLTGLKALDIYIFMRDYDYQNKSFADFSQDANARFGVIAGTVLAAALVGKSLAELWGARATTGFVPTIKYDEDFMNEYFGTDQQIY